eukprot:COSAG04_NODE_26074_length_299_cov_3.430000_1_plen_67_part_10
MTGLQRALAPDLALRGDFDRALPLAGAAPAACRRLGGDRGTPSDKEELLAALEGGCDGRQRAPRTLW